MNLRLFNSEWVKVYTNEALTVVGRDKWVFYDDGNSINVSRTRPSSKEEVQEIVKYLEGKAEEFQRMAEFAKRALR